MNKRLLFVLGLAAAAGAYGKTATTATITNVTPAAPPANFGVPVTITATVTPNPGPETVVFFDGTNQIGTATLSTGTAQLTTTLLPVGRHELSVTYLGDATYKSDRSPLFVFKVSSAVANTFLPAVNYSSGGQWPEAVAVGTFGKGGSTYLGIAVANYGSNNVTVLKDSATGTFSATALPYPVCSSPRFVAVGDFDLDHVSDLAVACSGGSVAILIGKNDGTFKPAVFYNAGPTPYAIALADFDGDGIVDLAVANDIAGISILLGNGDGTFTPSHPGYPDFPSIRSVYPSSIAAAFIDPGRKADLVVTNITQGTVSVLLGNGDGTFGAPITSPIVSLSDPACAHRPFTFALGDFNGDNEVDLAVLDQGSTNACTLNPPMISPIAPAVYLLRGVGNGLFTPATTSYPVGNYPTSIVAGDFNGDGKLDWAAAGSYSNLLFFKLGDGTGNFPQGSTRTAGTLPTGLAVGEFNNDKITDLVVANFFDNNVSILQGH